MTAAGDVTAPGAEPRDELRAVARDVLAKAAPPTRDVLADLGWLGLELPERLHGSAATFAEVAVVLEELGRAASGVPYVGSVVLGLDALTSIRGDAVAEGQVRRIADGGVTYAVALGHGIDAPAPFVLERRAGRVHLRGEATFVPDAPAAQRLVLLADDGDAGTVAVDVAADLRGLTVRELQVVDATRTFGTVAAAGVEVHPSAVRPFEGAPDVAVRRLHDRGALAVALDGLGLMAAMLDATVAYAKARHQFGRPIGSFQAVKHACADMLVSLRVGRELADAAVAAVVERDPAAWVPVSMAKAFLTTAAVDVVGKAMQLHGGVGYTWESGVHAYLKRAMLDRSLFGAPVEHRRRLATRYG